MLSLFLNSPHEHYQRSATLSQTYPRVDQENEPPGFRREVSGQGADWSRCWVLQRVATCAPKTEARNDPARHSELT